jgi:hypothetical protein
MVTQMRPSLVLALCWTHESIPLWGRWEGWIVLIVPDHRKGEHGKGAKR